MLSPPKGIFDTSGWIFADREQYPPAVFPCIWKRLESDVAKGVIASPRAVVDEIEVGYDLLKEWGSTRKQALVSPLLESGKLEAAETEAGLLKATYKKLSKKDADYYVIAWAKVLGCPVVTNEEYKEGQTNPAQMTRIPNVCKDAEVECLSFLEFMQRQNWRFE